MYWLFGCARDLDSAQHLINLTRDSYVLNIPLNKLKEEFWRLEKFSDPSLVPDYARESGLQVGLINLEFDRTFYLSKRGDPSSAAEQRPPTS